MYYIPFLLTLVCSSDIMEIKIPGFLGTMMKKSLYLFYPLEEDAMRSSHGERSDIEGICGSRFN